MSTASPPLPARHERAAAGDHSAAPSPSAVPATDEPPARTAIPRGVWFVAALTFAMFAANAVVSPVLDELVRGRFGAPDGSSRFMMAASLPHLLLGVLVGLWSDRLSRRLPFVAAGLLAGGALMAAIPHAPSFQAALLLRVLEGVAVTFPAVLLFASALDQSSPGNRGRVMALTTAAIPFGYLTGNTMVWLCGAGRLELLFALSGGLVAAAGVAAAIAARRERPTIHRTSRLQEMLEALRETPKLALPLAVAFVDKFTFAAIAVLTSLAIKDLHGVAESSKPAAQAMTAFWIAFATGCAPVGRLIDRFGARLPLALGSIGYGATMMALGTVSLTGFITLMGACGFFSAIMYAPSYALVGQIASPAHRGHAMGAFNTFGMLGLLIGFPVCSIVAKQQGYGTAYAVAGGLEVAAGALVLLLLALRRR